MVRQYSHTGTTAELAAFGTLIRRLLPGPLQLPLFAELQAVRELHQKRYFRVLKLFEACI